jgi:PIN domain nuclease of toxin-antitoxin system
VIVLDTHVLVWWVTGDPQVSHAARTAIESAKEPGQILVSTISALEIAMLVDRGRLALAMDVDDWFNTVKAIEQIHFVPVDVELATKSVSLPGEFHKDPSDRIIVATARKFAMPLITKDEKIRNYPHIRTIW